MRASFLKLIFIFIPALLVSCKDRAEQKEVRPNVIIINVDAQRADHLGCYGSELDTSPFLDEETIRALKGLGYLK